MPRIVGPIQAIWVSVLPCEPSDDSPSAPVLPAPLAALAELVDEPAVVLAPGDRRTCSPSRPEVWARSGHDPVKLLGAVAAGGSQELAGDKKFLRAARPDAQADLEDYLTGDALVPDAGRGPRRRAAIAYFSPEFGITAVLPAVLRRPRHPRRRPPQDRQRPRRTDHRASACSTAHGYFRQALSREGWQQETYPVLDPDGLPIALLREGDGTPAQVRLSAARRPRAAARAGLDGPGRPGAAAAARLRRRGQRRSRCARSPTGSTAARPSTGCCRSCCSASAASGRCARTAPLTGARGARGLPHQRGPRRLPAARAHPRAHRRRGRPASTSTTAVEVAARRHRVHHAHPRARRHRPLPARAGRAVLRRRPEPRLRRARRPDPAPRRRGLPGRRPRRVQHGRDGLPAGAARQRRLAAARRGQPRACSTVCGRASTRPRCRSPRSPTACTRPTWVAREVFELAAEQGAHDRRPARSGTSSTRSPAADLWSTAAGAAQAAGRGRPACGCASRGSSAGAAPAELGWIDKALDPDVLTIGFARRAASYKRLTLMLRDPERLRALLLHPERPVQLVIAGKAHPADDGGKKLIQADRAVLRRPRAAAPHRLPAQLRHRDGAAALPRLRRLAEQPAAAARGLRHLGHEGRPQRRAQPLHPRRLVGRVVRRRQRLGDPLRRRRRGPRPCATTSRRTPSTTWSRRRSPPGSTTSTPSGVPGRWIEMVRHTLKSLGPKVLSSRMVIEYVERLYAPAAVSSRAMNHSYEGARRAGALEVAGAWPAGGGVRVDHVETEGLSDAPEIGGGLDLHVFVSLGDLAPDDVDVEVVHGRVKGEDELVDTTISSLALAETLRGRPAPLRRPHRAEPLGSLRLHRADPAAQPRPRVSRRARAGRAGVGAASFTGSPVKLHPAREASRTPASFGHTAGGGGVRRGDPGPPHLGRPRRLAP